ncbi:MAG: hypothetical protein LBL39_06180 [Planctomycetaceae bacterium]|nr:hypothetical protein [Planctomycetaceae bacterium]
MDNPVQVQRSTGLGNLLNRNYVVVQQRKFILAVSVLNCYAVPCFGALLTPCCTVVCTGLSMLKSYGLKNHEQ